MNIYKNIIQEKFERIWVSNTWLICYGSRIFMSQSHSCFNKQKVKLEQEIMHINNDFFICFFDFKHFLTVEKHDWVENVLGNTVE